MRIRGFAVASMFLAGCLCDCGELEVVDGDRFVQPGEAVQLRGGSDGWDVGPGDCGGYWYVNYVRGGTEELGTIDHCGLYQAPDELPPGIETIFIEAMQHLPGTCADCCGYAWIQLEPDLGY